ncbi:hypothetical protein FGSG_11431 [Fusarium graminearum PH-1]|uniref:hypothetical protein n=1 Tax=Gibberella zeae (strain ATCC MYA-4620 / CBS 123657 / FGSC 9075 / NRRL 31084 / PH-1) TaxID=229533 RepID=UPI000023D4E8|nr:hypothetical protein FGSG_11431 [Fusarium graminearum PH-1]ESU18170.1 hypothetical protein FGSG_11431 [Fusarium graminearum PH-1]|eukprot:XP_011325792.1 hypothetical protein FGSG_11431 [Fusarium graminearum PH-1]
MQSIEIDKSDEYVPRTPSTTFVMQRDTELTFMDIHGTPNAMLASLEDIVCSENFTSTSVEQPLDLRFLEVDTINSNDQNPILRLTEKGQYIGNKDYVAVSYTWQRFDPITNTEAISRFRVSVGGSVRKARSQDAVLHRAIEFARSTNTPRIWIDQDCIEQYDPDDLQQHLHVVHKIFQQSQHAIALLSFHIRHQHQADSIRCINQGTFLDELEMPLEMAADVISGLADTIARTGRVIAGVNDSNIIFRPKARSTADVRPSKKAGEIHLPFNTYESFFEA